MISIAFLALILTVFVQALLLQRAVVLEQRMRVEVERQRAMAEAEAQRARAVLDMSLQQVHEQ
jgi:hypothetical protein